MKLLSAAQIGQADAYTIEHEPVSSIALMERAASRAAVSVAERFAACRYLVMVCGPGNNGGDGLAMARLLQPFFDEVLVYCFGDPVKRPADFTVNDFRLREKGITPQNLSPSDAVGGFPAALSRPGTVIGDALFGTGLSKPVTDDYFGNVIAAVNGSGSPVFSVDIPSGLSADDDRHREKNARVVRADVTYTFEQPKRSFLFAENAPYTGRVEVVPIGLHRDFMETAGTSEFFITRTGVSQLRKPTDGFSHKGTYGHAVVAGGSKGKSGSVLLAVQACMSSGAGLTTACAPETVCPVIWQQAPEAMCIAAGGDYLAGLPEWPAGATALGIGVGIGREKETAGLLKRCIAEAGLPMVWDADALNILSENKTWLSFLPSDTILTPHPKEFDRLTQTHETGYTRWLTQVEFSKKHRVYVVLKGAHTSVTTPRGKTFFNTTGNPGMATGGSGDVLTGILTGLLAQGYPPVDACLLGVYVHGLAGDLAFRGKGREALVASDITACLGEAFRAVFENDYIN